MVGQSALIAAIVVAWFVPPRWPDALRVPGFVLGVAGAGLAVWSVLALRRFTPLPEPRAGATLVTRGPYRLARHPMYGGLLLFFAGVSLLGSLPELLLTGALAVLWWRKTLTEEERLRARFPDYDVYRARTPRRFLPFVA